jgi:predicted metal-dependent HD superfamily phosphohydrolase
VQIRREYDWVPEETFAAKRAEVLRRFTARERIYTSEEFYVKYEQQARLNLENSIRSIATK